jgi:hypothetical protein
MKRHDIPMSTERGKWRVRIQIPGKRLYVGEFESRELAEQAYAEAKLQFDDAPTTMPLCSDDAHEADDPREEAAALFQLALNESDFDGIRSLIVFSPMEQYVAAYFCAAGLVAQTLMFRTRVLEEFDSLVLRYRPGKEHPHAQDQIRDTNAL